MQQKTSPILTQLSFDPEDSDKDLLKAVEHFREKDGILNKSAPTAFLSDQDQQALWNNDGGFRVSLYKMLLFQQTTDAIKRGSLNLKHSYKYKAIDDYLILKEVWNKDQDELLEKANLSHLKELEGRIGDYKTMIAYHFNYTNTGILKEKIIISGKAKKGIIISVPLNPKRGNSRQILPFSQPETTIIWLN